MLKRLSFVLITVAALLPTHSPADADTRVVNCGPARRLEQALRVAPARPLTLIVRGDCVENLVITRDDVTLQGDAGSSISPIDPALATIRLDGARRVSIVGLEITGGAGAVVGTTGATFHVGARQSPAVPCLVTGGTRFGVIASYGAVATVDGCTIQNVSGDGVVAANTSSLTITNSTVQTNTGSGIVAVRSSQLRIGQDSNGSAVVRPVTVSENGANGILIIEGSSGNVVGGAVTGHPSPAIFIGRSSSGQIGLGSGNLLAGVSVTANDGEGIMVEGANATILGNTVTGNGGRGINVRLSGSARIGINNLNNTYVGNTISGNRNGGLLISTGASAWIGGNAITDNVPNPVPANAFVPGVNVSRATAVLIGGNTISGHVSSGVFVRAGSVQIGDSSFGALSPVNTISGNGNGGGLGSLGGITAFQGGIIETRQAIIENNFGNGGSAFQESVIELRESTIVRNNLAAPGQSGDFFDAGHGLIAGLKSTIRPRDTGTLITGNAGNGVQIQSGSGVDFRNSTTGVPNVEVKNNVGQGLRCFAESFYSGNVLGITGNLGGGNNDGTTNPSFGNIPDCPRF